MGIRTKNNYPYSKKSRFKIAITNDTIGIKSKNNHLNHKNHVEIVMTNDTIGIRTKINYP